MQTNNNSSQNGHCFNCGKELESGSGGHKFEKREYPVCNQKTDTISIEKHLLCLRCTAGFDSVKTFVLHHQLKSFSKQFRLQRVIDSSFIKMANMEASFVKENKRQSQIFESTSSLKAQQQNQEPSHSKQKVEQLDLNLPSDIYSAIINDTIESENLHHVYWLPKTLQYLIHLTAKQSMRPEERRERVKKTIQGLSYIYCIDESELKYLAILVQTLFCYMDEQALVKILNRLLRGFLQNNISLEFFLVEDDEDCILADKVFEQRHIHQKSIEYRPDCILHIIFSLYVLFDFFKDSKLQRHFSELVHLAHQELSKKQQGLSRQSSKALQKTYEGYLKKNISDHGKLPKLSESSWQQLVQGKRQKNHLNLIIRTIKKQQQQNQDMIKEMENKFKKQKDQYINKIVKLNNQIEDLQNQLKNIKENGVVLGNSRKSSKQIRLKEDNEEVRSNPELKTENLKQNKPQPVTERTEVPFSETKLTQDQTIGENKKHKSEIQVPKSIQEPHHDQTLDYLKSILQITDLINFNNKSLKKSRKQSASFPLPQLPNTLKELSQLIIAEIDSLEKKVSSLLQQNKKLKEESSRLLAILKRKEQSWLPLLHQKDEIISLYEKALICMEKGYILAQEPLSSRIQAIVESVAKVQFKRLEPENDDNSARDSTSVRDSIVEQFPEDLEVHMENTNFDDKQAPRSSQKKTPLKQKKSKVTKSVAATSNEKSGENKIKKKSKKEKQKEKECLIY